MTAAYMPAMLTMVVRLAVVRLAVVRIAAVLMTAVRMTERTLAGVGSANPVPHDRQAAVIPLDRRKVRARSR